MHDVQRLVAETSDRLGLHSTAPNLLLDLQVRLGSLAAEVLRATQHGRRPFRPSAAWDQVLGDVAFTLVNLADQTGVDLDRAIRAAAEQLFRASAPSPAQRQPGPASEAWPFSG